MGTKLNLYSFNERLNHVNKIHQFDSNFKARTLLR